MRRFTNRLVLLTLSMLSLGSALAHAQWPGQGLVLHDSGTNGSPGLEFLRDGTGGIGVWDFRPSRGIAIQRLDALTGAAMPGWTTGSFRPLTFDPAGSSPAVTPDGAGGFWHALYVPRPTPGTRYFVGIERISSTGTRSPLSPTTWTLAGVDYNSASVPATAPGIAPDDSGGAYVAFVTRLTKVRLVRLRGDAELVPGWPTVGAVVGNQVSTAAMPPTLARDGAAGVVVMWNAGDSLMVGRWNSDSTHAAGWPTRGLRLNPGSYMAPSATFARLIPSGASHMIAVWAGFEPDAIVQTLRLARFGLDGTRDPAWPAGGIIVRTSSTLAVPGVAADGAGGVHLLWGESAAIRWTHVLTDGTVPPAFAAGALDPLDAAGVLSPGLNYGKCAPGVGGSVLIAWNDSRTSRPGIRVRALRADGSPEPTWPDTGLVTTSDHPGTLRALESDGDVGAHVAWQTYLNYSNDSWIQHLRPVENTLAAPPLVSGRVALTPSRNPVRGTLALTFTLATNAAARLQLLDLAGRVVRSVEVSGAGPHRHEWSGLEQLAPGVYLARLEAGAASGVARVAILR